MNLIAAYHPDRPIRQRFRDHMLETIMERYSNEELYSFSLHVSPKEAKELYEKPYRKEELKKMAETMVTDNNDEVKVVLKKMLNERFENCQF